MSFAIATRCRAYNEAMSDFILIAATIVFFAICVLYIKWCDGARADGTVPGDRFFDPIERFIYGVCGLDHKREQRWNVYALSLVAFSLVSLLMLYGLQRLQGSLAFNPTGRAGVTPWGAWNVALSFVTNTNWQWYSEQGHDEPPHPDDRADRAELRVGCRIRSRTRRGSPT